MFYKSENFHVSRQQAKPICEEFNDAISNYSEALSDVPSDIIIKSRIKYGSRWSACKGLLLDYFRSSNIHGIPYIFSVHRPFYERFFWLICTVTSFYFAVLLIWDTLLKWQDTPVILGFDETLVPVHKIPFPTITICPEIKMEQKSFDFANMSERIWKEYEERNTTQNFENFSQEDFQNFAATLHICEEDVVTRFIKFVPKDIRPQVSETLVKLSVSKNVTAPFCKWNSRYYFCDKIFEFVATDEGICYQFNGLHPRDLYRDVSYINYYDEEIVDFQNFFDDLPPLNNITGDWNLEAGYVKQGYNSYPQRTAWSSTRNGFFAFLQGFEHNFEYSCRSFKQGYRIFMNSPESVAFTSGNYILLPHGDEVMVSVLPQYVIGEPSLRELAPEKRQCYFNDERYLRYFKYYSQSNCQTECLTNYTIGKCGCAKFWMPKPSYVRVCDVSDIICYIGAQKELHIMMQNQTIEKQMCNCMSACTSLEYNFEISQAKYDMSKTLQAFREDYEHIDYLGSRLSVYFKEKQFTAIKRSILFSVTTLIANCGGILGLFMGISTLSIIELFYFLSVRLIDNLRMRHHTKEKLRKIGTGYET